MVDLLPVLLLVPVALLGAWAAGRTRVPYTVALVLFGLAVGLVAEFLGLPGVGPSVGVLLAPSVFFPLLLPPIVFEAGLNLDARLLRRRAGLVLFLVFVGVVFTTLFTGYLLAAVVALPLAAALLLASILSPTDPIAVVDLFRRLRVPRELAAVVESESLLNDAVGIVAFVVLLGLVNGTTVGPVAVAGQFLWLVAGGLGVGLLVAGAVHLLRRVFRHPYVGLALSVASAYGAYLAANALGASGVLAVAVAGVAYGTWVVPDPDTGGAPGLLPRFWSTSVYVANSVIFLAMGLAFALTGLVAFVPVIALVFVLITAARALFVYAHRPLARAISGPGDVLPDPWYPLLAASGVRGALPMVLAISLAEAPGALAPATLRTVVATVVGVVLVSLLVNNAVAEWYVERRFGAPGISPR